MRFLPDTPQNHPAPRGHRPVALGRWLLACCAIGVAATAFPWTYIAASRLFEELQGPIGARTSPGFTCAITCVLTALLVMAEGRSKASREAVRTACFVLMAAACFVVIAHLFGGAMLRGVEAERSLWFFAAAIAVATGLLVSKLRMPRNA